MNAVFFSTILPVIAAAGILLPLCLRYDPQSAHARWLQKGVTGLFMLIAWNALPGLPHVGMNPISVMVAGGLGVSGAMALALLR